MIKPSDFQAVMESFPWESDEQKEGFLTLVHYLHKFGIDPEIPLQSTATLTALFFIQKDHESNEYWRELAGTQFSDLQDQVRELQKAIGQQNSVINALMQTVEAQQMVLRGMQAQPFAGAGSPGAGGLGTGPLRGSNTSP